ncbi:hypothetical protein DFJ74DRAFT_741875 [Hyaloraphidium curvatum]|nr:hypothetical protein DFJ74DRAFT_741875 [Hyaloraphidium curvatum]
MLARGIPAPPMPRIEPARPLGWGAAPGLPTATGHLPAHRNHAAPAHAAPRALPRPAQAPPGPGKQPPPAFRRTEFAPDRVRAYGSVAELLASEVVENVEHGRIGRDAMQGIVMVELVAILTSHLPPPPRTHPSHAILHRFLVSDPPLPGLGPPHSIACAHYAADLPFPSLSPGDEVRVLGMPRMGESGVEMLCYFVGRCEEHEADLVRLLATTACEGVTPSPADWD